MAWDPFGVKQRRVNREKAKATAGQSRGAVEELLSGMGERSEQAMDESELSAEELYGDQMQTARDRIASNVAGGISGVTRSSMAGGGDFSGRGAASTLALIQAGNEAGRDVELGFSDRADSAKRYNLGRSDQLASAELSGKMGLFNVDQNEYNSEIERQRARKQALAQFGSDLIGSAANVAGAAVGKPG